MVLFFQQIQNLNGFAFARALIRRMLVFIKLKVAGVVSWISKLKFGYGYLIFS